MPGLKQLKKFSENMITLGDEANLRTARGEKAVSVPIPSVVEDRDDSEDFVIGLPEQNKEPQNQDLNDVSVDSSKNQSDKILDEITNNSPDLDDALSSIDSETSEPSESDLDDFLKSIENSDAESTNESKNDVESIIDSDLENNSLDNDFSFDGDEINLSSEMPDLEDDSGENNFSEMNFDENEQSHNSQADSESFDIPEFNDLENKSNEETVQDNETDSISDDLPDLDENSIPDDFLESGEDSISDDLPDLDENSIPDDFSESGEDSISDDLPGSDENSISDDFPESGKYSASDDLPDLDENSIPDDSLESGEDSVSNENEETSSDDKPDLSFDDDIDTSDIDFNDFALDTNSQDKQTKEELSPENDSEIKNDASINFDDIPDTDSQISENHSEFGDDNPDVDFDDENFEIPGFSDIDIVPTEKKLSTTPNFSSPVKPENKNELTEEEYEQFKKNLAYYPLNLRLEIEKLIVHNEFTDDAVFDVIKNVIKKIPVRQLASQLGKMLDITLAIPRDFEKRTVEEYENYKTSLQYQLRNKIIPGFLAGFVLLIVVLGIMMFSRSFIYEPMSANRLYKQGYELLKANEYTQSEAKFNEATKHYILKKWFFKYAEGYRDHKQYTRAENMYEKTMKFFDHDKKAGSDYARMETEDLGNYERAEKILKRDVLDYYINDKDALLQLGDNYLDWGTEKDSSKFDDAYEQYSFLVQLYGPKNIYLSRMLRYFIRTDDLRQVLKYKDIFYPKEKSLDSQGWTELSGYLMNKLYGNITPSEKYLKPYIQDIRGMLQFAVDTDPSNPVASYNFGRYFVYSKQNYMAERYLNNAIKLFNAKPHRTKHNTYKEINTYRLLGELYKSQKDYIKAGETYTNGITLFENENSVSDFSGDENTGRLYADMADIDYFVSKNMDSALRNYQNSIKNKNDNSIIRYHIGYIQYSKKDYEKAWGSFLKASENRMEDNDLLLALGNVLSLRDDNYAARGYYEHLLSNINISNDRKGLIVPKSSMNKNTAIDTYMKASNNLGVVLNRIAAETGNSKMNAESMVRFSESNVAWDYLTRNKKTLLRLQGSNLASQNMKYVYGPDPDYKPEIYTEIPLLLDDEQGFD